MSQSTHAAALAAAIVAHAFLAYEDLTLDVSRNVLSAADANAIAAKRGSLETTIDADEYRVAKAAAASRQRTAGGNMATKGMGHRSLKAKAHGKSTVCTSGAGYGRYDAARLYRVA